MKESALPETVSATYVRGIFFLGIVAILSACVSEDEGVADAPDYMTPSGQIASVDVTAGDTSAPADSIETVVLQENAAQNAAAGINVNMAGVSGFSSAASSVATIAGGQTASLLDDSLRANDGSTKNDLLNDAIASSVGSLQSDSLTMLVNAFNDPVNELSDDSNRLLIATLGLDDSGNATSTREGNRITIDPDDAAVCVGDTFIVDDMATAASQAQCMELVSQLTVQLDAVTEQQGEITYLFNLQPLLVIGYGPRNVMYELKLDVLHQLELLSEQLSGGSGNTPTTMRGAVRLALSVDNDSPGSESGSLALAISEPVFIEQDGERMSLAPSTIFTIAHDQSVGTASLTLGLGALEFIFKDTDSFTDSPTGEVIRMALGGLSGQFDLSDDRGTLDVTNLGFINGPMTIAMGNSMSAAISMPPLGFSLAENSGELMLNTALNIAMNTVLYDSEQGNTSVDLNVMSPSGTLIDTVTNSAFDTVKSGGPLQLNYNFSSDGYSLEGYVSWSPGSCEAASSDSDLTLYTCDDVLVE